MGRHRPDAARSRAGRLRAPVDGEGGTLITRATVVRLGVSQLVTWGITYYLIGGFGESIAGDTGWSHAVVFGGFSVSLLTMGLVSPLAGRLIDRKGGRHVMAIGSLFNAGGCAGLALSHDLAIYYGAWIVLGFGMRFSLYEAAFAALARIGGPEARRPIAQITLLGGLASSVFWPLGHFLAEQVGWRGALLVYAAIALLTLPLHLSIPVARYDEEGRAAASPPSAPLATGAADRLIAGGLYAAIASIANFLNSGMSAHMIGILTGLGLAMSASVWIATLRGVGQSLARLCEVLFGRRTPPLKLNVIATLILPPCFVAGLLSGAWLPAALAFAFFYGAGNGILTITRGTMPLVLFDHRVYGRLVGGLLAPSFFLSAVAPVAYALVIERFGEGATLHLSVLLAALMFAAALALQLRFPSKRGG